jgi:hypothetical protein
VIHSTLRAYVHALGGKLRVVDFGDREYRLAQPPHSVTTAVLASARNEAVIGRWQRRECRAGVFREWAHAAFWLALSVAFTSLVGTRSGLNLYLSFGKGGNLDSAGFDYVV